MAESLLSWHLRCYDSGRWSVARAILIWNSTTTLTVCWKEWAELDGKESYREICMDALSSRRLIQSCSVVLLLLTVHCVTVLCLNRIDARKLHYMRKALVRHGLVGMQSHCTRVGSGQQQHSILLMLKRFYVNRCVHGLGSHSLTFCPAWRNFSQHFLLFQEEQVWHPNGESVQLSPAVPRPVDQFHGTQRISCEYLSVIVFL